MQRKWSVKKQAIDASAIVMVEGVLEFGMNPEAGITEESARGAVEKLKSVLARWRRVISAGKLEAADLERLKRHEAQGRAALEAFDRARKAG